MIALMSCASLAATLASMSCAHNVSQDATSGADGNQKGAKPVLLENGEGRATGIVTYPGGDRADWKLVELPAKKRGTLDLQLAWAPPRPGLQLAFDVFDEWGQDIVKSEKTSKKRSKGRIRTAQVEGASGKYFVRVYAVGRGDAGKYKLTVDFKEKLAGPAFDPLKLEIADPPKLPAVPEAEKECDEFTFDIKNPACKSVCPATGAPPNWPGCTGKCPAPDINNSACWPTMDCPNPPDRRVKRCTKDKFVACPDPAKPDPANPNCDGIKVPPVIGKVVAKTIQGNRVIITIGIRPTDKVAATWTGVVLNGNTESPLSGGEVEVIRAEKGVVVGKVKLSVDQLSQNPRVRLSAP
jgi:hypothetical protein